MDDMAFSPPAGQSIQTLKSKGVEDDTRGKKTSKITWKPWKWKAWNAINAIFFPISDKTTIFGPLVATWEMPMGTLTYSMRASLKRLKNVARNGIVLFMKFCT